MRVSLVSIALAVAVAGCGPDEASVSTTTSADTSPSSTSAVSSSSPTEPTTSSTTFPATATTTTPEIDVEFIGGEAVGPNVFEVELGETADIWILSDVDDEIHVHGYDLTYDLAAGEPLHLSFVADVPGIFEVEVHTGHTVFFEVKVSG